MLDDRPRIIGRDKAVDVRFNHSGVSRQHAEITFKENRFIIRDLGSTNGTLLNKDRVDKNGLELVHGDKIVLGVYEKFIVLRFSISGATTGTAKDKVIELNSSSRDIYINGKLLAPPLAKRHFDVFELLYSNDGTVCSLQDIYKAGWEEDLYDKGTSDEAIQKVIRRIRDKIEPNPSEPKYIKTYHGVGYRFDNPKPK